MKNILFIIIIFILFFNGSCKKEEPITPEIPPVVVTKTNLSVKWYRYFYSDTTGSYFKNPYFFGNYVAFCSNMTVYGNGQLGIGVFNKLTGEKHIAWNSEPGNIVLANESISDWLIGGNNNNYAVFKVSHRICCFDLNTNIQKWSLLNNDFLPRINNFGNNVFCCDAFQTHANLYRINIETGNSVKILTINKTNGYEPSFESYSGWISPIGDTILIFQNRQWNFSASLGKIDIYAYNLSADSVLWKLENLTNDGNSSIRKPIIVGNKLLFQGMKSVHCINLLTGQIIWEQEYTNEGFAEVDNLYADGKLFAHSGSQSVMAFDANSGNLLWKTPAVYGIQTGGSMGYYKGKLYFTGIDHNDQNVPTHLFCLDASNGGLLWKGSGFNTGMKDGVIIDQATGYLYANDSYRVMCIDLNKTPVTK